MVRQEVLKHPVRVLTETQRAQFFADGFLVLPDYVPTPVAPASEGRSR
jgi:hypothetical protein